MHSPSTLLGLHERTHECIQGVLNHCEGFSSEELHRELEGFGFATILQQFHHAIGAEAYWIGVLQGKMLVDRPEEERQSIETLRTYRSGVAKDTVTYLESVTDQALNASCEVTTWGNKQTQVVPANVVVRTQVHLFQHKGQIAAMARLLGRPMPQGLDYPLR